MAEKSKPERYFCALCEREVRRADRHHLIPKSKGGRVMVELCLTCHKTLHSYFTNDVLERELNTIEALREQPDVARYLAWVRKRPDSQIQIRERRAKWSKTG
jgi:5-methylcytosine-specific restriction enzyme A